jgi:deazaflavin-dependent oxidoreductase (nitroreductase family)
MTESVSYNHIRKLSKRKRLKMAKKSNVPIYVRMANKLTSALLRMGVKLMGPGKSPMYLITVRGRKSGLPRTTPIATLERDGQRYILTPYGVVDWVRNLRAAGTANLTRGRRTDEVRAVEVPVEEASHILKDFIDSGNPIARFFGLPAGSPQEDIDQLAATHPVFSLQNVS